MNIQQLSHLAVALLLVGVQGAIAQNTAFTYQGQLVDTGAPAAGGYSLRFILYNAEFGGSQVGPTLTNEPVAVTGGLFTTALNFGATVLDGSPRWLEIAVRTNGSAAVHTALSPRQPLGSAPYAFRAARVTGILPDSQLSANVARLNENGTFIGSVVFDPRSGPPFAVGNSEVVAKLNADMLDGLDASDFAPAGHNHDTSYWKLAGNAGANPTNGAFLGTTDNLPLEFRVNNSRAVKFEPGNLLTVSVLAGSPGNRLDDSIGGTIFGGSSNNPNRLFSAQFAAISGGYNNTISNTDLAVIAGGSGNHTFGGFRSFIGGGSGNQIGGTNRVGGGSSGSSANNCIVGGAFNFIGGNSGSCVIGGGDQNRIAPASFTYYATVPGGFDNEANGYASFAAGFHAKANHSGAFVWADSTDADFASTGTDQFLIRASGGVGIGTASPSRKLEVSSAGSTEIGLNSTDPGAHLWTLQSTAVMTGDSRDASFQIIDRTLGLARLLIGTNGNVGIGTSAPANRLHVNGGITCTALTETSDRNAKENFVPVAPLDVLEKVASLPISTWNFKELRDGRHMGPMAQDFYAAFGLGDSDTTITSVDPDGVALAAIQGLNEKVEVGSERAEVRTRELEQRLEQKETEITELKQRLEALEKLINTTSGGIK